MSTPSFSPSVSPNPQDSWYGPAEEDVSIQSGDPSVARDQHTDGLSHSSPSCRSPDSLADASYSEVEARALDFLASSPPSTEPSALPAAFDALDDLPRKLPTLPADQLEGHLKAVEFLRRRLDDAEGDDWMYRTPAVFDAPATVEAKGSSTRSEAEDEMLGEPLTWTDRAFNLERYGVADSSAEVAWLVEDPLRGENGDLSGT
ncbi:hypothetical protein JCM11251_001681 [Rhodosporidiobolus azoricus]